jgi:hypothetical protein
LRALNNLIGILVEGLHRTLNNLSSFGASTNVFGPHIVSNLLIRHATTTYRVWLLSRMTSVCHCQSLHCDLLLQSFERGFSGLVVLKAYTLSSLQIQLFCVDK